MPEHAPAFSARSAVVIDQTLHGYHHGHRLLTASAAFTDHELALLDRLSDLSGYLPPKTDFEFYHTGFPCGRFYALACTYPDRKAKREGTVLTHTLLIPLDLWASLDLDDLLPLHRQPSSAEDRAPYQSALSLIPRGAAPATALRDPPLLALAALYLGQAQRPILWQDPQPTLSLLIQFLRILWPAARRAFAFCTFALQARKLNQRPFDFLALPDSARGSFHEVSGLPSWFVEGHLPHPAAQALLTEPWLLDLQRQGGAWISDRLAFVERWRLPPPEPTDLYLLHRTEQLSNDAALRLPAARALADLLHGRFALPPEHPLWLLAMDSLLTLQAEAPMEPRPLWEMIDFLARPQVQARSAASPDFVDRVATMLRDQLPRRRHQSAEATAAAWLDLLRVVTLPQWRSATLETIDEVIHSAADLSEAQRWVTPLLRPALRRRDVELAAALLRSFSPEDRLQVLQSAALEASPPGGLAPFLKELSQRLDDLLVVFAADPQASLRTLTEASWADASQQVDLLRRALPICTASERLEWALRGAGPPEVTALAVQQGVEAMLALHLPLAALAQQLALQPTLHGARMLRAAAERIRGFEDRETALRESPELTLLALIVSLQSTDSYFFGIDALKALPTAHLLRRELREGLECASDGLLRRSVLELIIPQLLRAVDQHTLDGPMRDDWLRSSAVHAALKDMSDWRLFAAFPFQRPEPQTLATLASAFSQALTQPAPLSPVWLGSVLDKPLKSASALAFETAVPALLVLLDLPLTKSAFEDLSARVMEQTRIRQPPSGYRLIERLFKPVYSAVLSKHENIVTRILTFATKGWDRGEAWRHFLIDSWMARGWPLDSFLRCALTLDNDKQFLELIERATDRNSASPEFLRALASAADANPDLKQRWRDAIHKSLRQR